MNKNVKRLCVTAVLLSLAVVLSELVPHFEMPLGGSVTPFSMLPVIMIALMYGTGWGLAASTIYAVIQLAFGLMEGILGWGLTPFALTGMIVFDYILAYVVLGLAGLFKSKGIVGIAVGTALSVVLRFVCHFISGCTFCAAWSEWENVYWYSFCYNGAYMLPELILTVSAAVVLFRVPQIKRLISKL